MIEPTVSARYEGALTKPDEEAMLYSFGAETIETQIPGIRPPQKARNIAVPLQAVSVFVATMLVSGAYETSWRADRIATAVSNESIVFNDHENQEIEFADIFDGAISRPLLFLMEGESLPIVSGRLPFISLADISVEED